MVSSCQPAGSRQPIEFHRITLNICRTGDHPANLALEHVHQVGFPFAHEGLRAGDGDLVLVHIHRNDAVALGKGERHQRRHRRDIDLQWVNAIERLLRLAGQPAGQGFHIQGLAGPAQILRRLPGDEFQRMLPGGRAGSRAAQQAHLLGTVLTHPPLRHQSPEQIGHVQQPVVFRAGQLVQVFHPFTSRSRSAVQLSPRIQFAYLLTLFAQGGQQRRTYLVLYQRVLLQ